MAVASMIGYLPDMIYNPLFGIWLDKYENAGYLYIFGFLAASGIVGLAAALYIRRYSRAHAPAKAVAQAAA